MNVTSRVKLKAGWPTGSGALCGREELLLASTLTFLAFKIFYLREKIYKAAKDREGMKGTA